MTTTGDEIVFPGPGEIEGFWALDKMHAPRPVTPLSFDLVVHPLAEGFTKAQAEYDCPIMVTTKEVNHFLYVAFHPIPDDAEIQRRLVNYHDKLACKVPTIGKTWEEEWKPAVIATNVPLKTADYSGLSDAELVAKLDELTDEMRHQWWIHGHINFVLLSSSAFCDLYDKVDPAGRTDRVVPDAAGVPHPLGGRRPRPVGAQPDGPGRPTRCASCSRRRTPATLLGGARRDRRGPGLPPSSSTSSCSSSAGATTPCSTSPTSRGGRTRRSLWRASPASSTLDDSEDPEQLYRQRVARREELLANLRTKLADDPDTLAKLDELYEAARVQLPAHRGPRLLHRPAVHRRVPPLRPGCRRSGSSTRA